MPFDPRMYPTGNVREPLPEAAKQEVARAMRSGAFDRIVFSNGLEIRAMSDAITPGVTTTDAPAGSIGITSHATGSDNVFVSDGEKWQLPAGEEET